VSNYYIEKEECLDRSDLGNLQFKKFNAMLKTILPHNQFYHQKFKNAGLSPKTTFHSDNFQKIPFTEKKELSEDQITHPPYGTTLTFPRSTYTRLHQTSGTSGTSLNWLDSKKDWQWFMKCWGIIYHAVHLKKEDILFFPFSFGPFIGFWAAFEGATHLGNLCLPGGGMTSLARLHFLLNHQVTVVLCTPTYALHLAKVAEDAGLSLTSSKVKALIVAGEPGGAIPSVRNQMEQSWGARVFDHTGMTEIGSLGIECYENPNSTHLIESECIAEVIDPKTKKHLPPGKEGELVLTNLGRWGSPLIRYRTGDLVRLNSNPCPCGRGFSRMEKGILGRVDDMIFIRGNNVYPSSIENLIRKFDFVSEFQVTVKSQNHLTEMIIQIELKDANIENSSIKSAQIVKAIRNQFHFRAEVNIVPPGTLPHFEMKAKRFVFE